MPDGKHQILIENLVPSRLAPAPWGPRDQALFIFVLLKLSPEDATW